jgi:hypothetical protein
MKPVSIKLLSLILCALCVSCDLYTQDDYREIVVLESYLTAGQPLPIVKVSTTLPASREYTFSEAGLNDAIILISRLNEQDETVEVFGYYPTPSNGVYLPINESYRVQATSTYRIDVAFNNRNDELSAVTTVPDQVQIINDLPDSVIYQSENQLELLLSPTMTTQTQNVYVFNTISLQPSYDNLTPFYRSIIDNEDDPEIADYIRNSSGLINEANFDINDDGTIRLRFPWIGVAFYGDNQVVTLSVDQNLADFVRSQEVQLGGSTLSPGEIPNLIYNVSGGIGVFGSISSDTIQTRFSRPF